jgi:hypothetical protein
MAAGFRKYCVCVKWQNCVFLDWSNCEVVRYSEFPTTRKNDSISRTPNRGNNNNNNNYYYYSARKHIKTQHTCSSTNQQHVHRQAPNLKEVGALQARLLLPWPCYWLKIYVQFHTPVDCTLWRKYFHNNPSRNAVLHNTRGNKLAAGVGGGGGGITECWKL